MLAAAAALAACSPAPPLDTQSSAITNGSNDDADPSVVALLQGTTLVCTATLIAPRVLVTAAHCVDPNDTLPAAHFGAVPGTGDVAVALTLARRHPAFDDVQLDHDIAVALLADDAPAGVTPSPLPPAGLADSDLGTTLRLVGYGRTAAGDTSAPRKRMGTAMIASLAADTFDFAPSPSQTCEGDSGGPAFASVAGGAEAIVGVTSSGDTQCDVMARDTRVDAYVQDFVAPFIAATAAGAAGAGDRCYYAGNCAADAGECLPALDDATLSFCAPPCTGGSCPAGLTCLADSVGVQRCRHATPSPGAAGASCTVDADCVGGGGSSTCVAAARGGGPVCAATCFPDLPGFCAASFDCLPVAGGASAGSACFAKQKGGCSFLPSTRAPAPWPLVLLFVAGYAVMAARTRSRVK